MIGDVKASKFAMKHSVNPFRDSSNFALSKSEAHLNFKVCHRLPFTFFQNDLFISFFDFETFTWAILKKLTYQESKTTTISQKIFTRTPIENTFLQKI